MLHLYERLAQVPVCGAEVPRGEPAREYRVGQLCPSCSAWQRANVERIKRKHGLA